MSKIIELATSLQTIYDVLNERYFDNELPEAILTIQTPTKASSRRSYDSWLYPFKWEDDNGVKYHEINLDPQHFVRPMVEIAAMLQHKMIHLYCLEQGIKDTSRNFRYHNEKFRYEAENRGLICTKSEDMGWNLTDYSEEFEVLIGQISADDVFNIRRIPGDIPPPII
jgi:hypothetical protein